jgi:uncharacterized protein YjfI (DUF2170 family)
MRLKDAAMRQKEKNAALTARDLARELSGADAHGAKLSVQPLPGDTEAIRVAVEGKEELPVFLAQTEEQILCICYLFEESEIVPSERARMHEAMLGANVSMPLSAFAKIEGRYALYGALSARSSTEDVVHEIETLADNAAEALEAMRDFLR